MTLEEFMAEGAPPKKAIPLDAFMAEGAEPQTVTDDFGHESSFGEVSDQLAQLQGMGADPRTWQDIQAERTAELTTGLPSDAGELDILQAEYEQNPTDENLIRFQVAQRQQGVSQEALDRDRQAMEKEGLTPEQFYQKEIYDWEQEHGGASARFLNTPVMRGAFGGPHNAALSIAATASRPFSVETSDKLGEMAADTEAFNQEADRQQGKAAGYTRQVTEMLAKYVPVAMTTGGSGILPLVFAEGQTSGYQEGKKAGLKGEKLDRYANGMGAINAIFTYLGGKVAGKLGAATIEELGAGKHIVPQGLKQFITQFAKGAGTETVVEEFPTYFAENANRYLEGIADGPVPETWKQDLTDIAVVSVLAQGAGSSPGVAQFLASPNKKTAEAAGIPPELSRTQRKRVELAEAVKAQLSNLNSSQSQTGQDGQEVSTILDTEPEAQAPTSPVDASVAETTTEPDQSLPTQPEPSGEAVGGEQAFTEPGRSRSLPEAVDALFKAQLRARGLSDAEISQLSPDDPLVQELIAQEPEAIRARMVPPVESTPPPKKRLGRKVHPPVATENVKQVLQNAPESKMDRLKREKREQENARNIRTGNGESPSQAKGWLRDAISRRPQGVNTPPEIATWLANGFSNSHYWKLLKKDGVTLEEAVAREMQPDIQNPVSEPAPNVPKAGQPQEDISAPSVAPPDAPSAVPPPSPQRDSGVAIAPTATARVSLDAIPNDIEVDVQAIKSKSGERVSVKQNAREAVAELDESIDLYKRLMACIRGGK
jgi:hypothetical protein